MRPSARIAALIELLTEVEEGIAKSGAPADVIVNQYFRARRYAGSKDRRAVSEMLYAILRNRELLLWLLEGKSEPRNLVLAYLSLHDKEMLALFEEEGPFAPDLITASEKKLLDQLQEKDPKNAPEAVQHNVPAWALSGLVDRFGSGFADAMDAVNESAPVDLRPNTLKVDDLFIDKFITESEIFSKTSFSPIGVRSEKNLGLGGIPEYKSGKLEVQDEAAQVASFLVDAQPGMQVADLCAGAGGKALLVSCQMANKGQLYAFDTSGKRLAECKKRAERGGNRNIQLSQLTQAGSGRTEKLENIRGKCDRVYVDVPCSGSGTWRRSPDQRWRFDAEKLSALTETQFDLLSEAAALVKQGGRLLYITCSLLPEENEAVVERFLNEFKEIWALKNYRDVWKEALGTECPETSSTIPEVLQLVPHIHHTDGFFVAIFERR